MAADNLIKRIIINEKLELLNRLVTSGPNINDNIRKELLALAKETIEDMPPEEMTPEIKAKLDKIKEHE